MKIRTLLVGATLPCATALVLAACESDQADPSPPLETPNEAGAPLPDGTSREAAADVVDAGPKRCSDEGFCPTPLPPNETLQGVWGDGTVVWSVSGQGDVLRWDGAAWAIHTKGLGPLYAVWGSGPTDLWLGGAEGLYHGTGASSDAITFTRDPGPDNAKIPILSIWGAGPNDIWAVGGAYSWTEGNVSRVLHRTRSGASAAWSVETVDDALVFPHVWGTAASGVWLLGNDYPEIANSILYHRAPSADAFTVVAITAYDPARGPVEGVIQDISGGVTTEDGTVILAGTSFTGGPGYWYGRPTPGGTYTWSYGDRDYKDERLSAFWNAGPNATWVAGRYGRLRQWDGAKWRSAVTKITAYPLIEPLYGIWGSSPDDFWVVGKDTALHRSPSAEGSR